MKLIRIQMLRTKDQLIAGHFYNQSEAKANELIARGFAKLPGEWPQRDMKPAGPSEIKPMEPAETKARVKKNSRRGWTENESS
jgi:hypothetical protein